MLSFLPMYFLPETKLVMMYTKPTQVSGRDSTGEFSKSQVILLIMLGLKGGIK